MTGRVAHGRPFIFCFQTSQGNATFLPMSQPDFQPTLVGLSLTVRPISRDDWTDMFAIGSDPEIWKVHPVPDRYTEAGFGNSSMVRSIPGWALRSSTRRLDASSVRAAITATSLF